MSDTRTLVERAMEHIEPREFTFDGFLGRRERRRRKQRIAAVVVAATVFLVPIWIVAEGSLDRTAAPAGTGPVSVAPEGAEPSSPATGQLVATLDARPGAGFPQTFIPVHQVWVYADGRVISRRERDIEVRTVDGKIKGVFGGITGYVERRLTPEGVDLLLSQLRSTGLFEHDTYLWSEQGLSWGEIEVRDGDHMVELVWCCPTLAELTSDPDQGPPSPFRDLATDATFRESKDLIHISDGLADLGSWLPAAAWEDPKPTAYVPSRYAVCYWRETRPRRTLLPSEISTVLPTSAQVLTGGKDESYEVFSSAIDVGPPVDPVICSELTSDQARKLDSILTKAGFEQEPNLDRGSLTYTALGPDPIGPFTITFEPILPHGSWELMGG